MNKKDQIALFTLTPLFERPKWKLFIYKYLKWPKSFKPTGYKEPPWPKMEDIKKHQIILGDCSKFKWGEPFPKTK